MNRELCSPGCLLFQQTNTLHDTEAAGIQATPLNLTIKPRRDTRRTESMCWHVRRDTLTGCDHRDVDRLGIDFGTKIF